MHETFTLHRYIYIYIYISASNSNVGIVLCLNSVYVAHGQMLHDVCEFAQKSQNSLQQSNVKELKLQNHI